MTWSVNHPDAGRLIAAYRHFGQEIPPGLIAPPLHDIEHDYWQAFIELSGDRSQGGPIPWTAIRRYYEVEGFGTFADFKRIIMTMDRAFLEANKSDE